MLSLMAAGGSAAPAAGTNRPPNVIFILADDLGYGDLGCYGQKQIQTPNLDRMAAEGMKFTRCYAGSTVCAPSRAALMTGQHTGHCRIRGNSTMPLAPEDVTVAEVLKNVGYQTAAIGKWGLGLEHSTGHPNLQGFDEWFGYLDQVHAHNYYPEFLWRNDRKLLLEKNLNGNQVTYSHDWFTTAALNFIGLKRDRPFFLYLAYTIPHAYSEMKTNGMPVPSDAPYTGASWPPVEKNKAAMITRMDRDIGRLFERLKNLKLDENTIVFFSSDNGPHQEGGVHPAFFHSSGPFRGIKRDLYEGGIRVPMLVRWPGQIKPDSVSEQIWAFWDFLPTVAELAGAKAPEAIDGFSILPALLGKAQTQQHAFLYWEFHEGGSKQAVRMGDWKAIRLDPGQPLELYNLETDPAERDNVANAHPEIIQRIENYLATARTESTAWPLKSSSKSREQKARDNVL